MSGQQAPPGLAYWARHIEGQAATNPALVAEFAAQPGFAEACRTTMRTALGRANRDPVMARVTRDMSRLMYGYLVLYLDARNNGITLSAIQEFCSEIGLASPGRAAAILVHMRAIGYIKPSPTPTDRRTRGYVPSLEMKAALREAVTGETRALSMIEPEALRLAERLEDPEIFKAYLQRLGVSLANMMRNSRPGSIALFADRNAGMIVLFDILTSAAEGDSYPPRGVLNMSVTALAAKFQVSRSHVFRLLRDAEKAGYLKRNADEQTGTITEKFAADLIEFHAYVFMGISLCAHFALTSNSGDPARSNGEFVISGVAV